MFPASKPYDPERGRGRGRSCEEAGLMAKESKMALVMDLTAKGLGNGDIAAKAGCSRDYVRACQNRARNFQEFGVMTPPRTAEREAVRRRRRYARNSEVRKRQAEANRRYYLKHGRSARYP